METIKIAVYGKGGIGKSTISANLSAALAERGRRVIQVGCDPKHDSTRLLLGARIPITALKYIKDVLPGERRPEDIVYRGWGDVACVEAGGPEPGVGCAGRGIITTFELLEDLGIRSSLFDITLYDVLGDVVCGGFAVPIRSEHADAVYIVTSGEYLSLFAANNILRGLKNFTGRGDRIAGIIFNARGGQHEDERVERFSEAVRLPVVVRIPRSEVFSRAEEEGCTLIERYPGTPEAAIFRGLADHVEDIRDGSTGLLHPAHPLSDDALERTVLMREDARPVRKYILTGKADADRKCISPSVKHKRPLFGCAFAGAISITAQVTDAATVMHCPRSCALMVCEKLLATEQASALWFGQPYDAGMARRLISTDMTQEDFIFGGEGKLHDALESAIGRGHRTIFVVTACPPGLTGDDAGKVSAAVLEKYPDIRIISIMVDGNLAGDGQQGRLDAYSAAAGLIAARSSPRPGRSVNIIAEKWGTARSEKDFAAIRDYLEHLGIAVNCRFLTRTPTASLVQFNEASLNLATDHDDTMESIRKILAPVSEVPFFEHPLPTGFNETRNWLLGLAQVFEAEDRAMEIIGDEEVRYREKISELLPDFAGKTLLISTYPRSYDWICDLASDLGMEILKVGLTYSPFTESCTSRYKDSFPVEKGYTVERRSEDIRVLRPDLVLFTYPGLDGSERARSAPIPYCPGYGFSAALEHAEKWGRLMRHDLAEGWKKDGEGLS